MVGAGPAWASGRAKAVGRVVGGHDATAGQFPFMAFVGYVNKSGNLIFICSGALVSSNVVLTAGHCTVNEKTDVTYSPGGYRIVTGTTNWTKAPRTITNVSKVK